MLVIEHEQYNKPTTARKRNRENEHDDEIELGSDGAPRARLDTISPIPATCWLPYEMLRRKEGNARRAGPANSSLPGYQAAQDWLKEIVYG